MPSDYEKLARDIAEKLFSDSVRGSLSDPTAIIAQALRTVATQARNEALEEAAVVADSYKVAKNTGQRNIVADWIADDLRALKRDPGQ